VTTHAAGHGGGAVPRPRRPPTAARHTAAPRWSRRSVLRAAGGGMLGLAVAGSGAAGYRAYDNGVFDADGGTAFDAWRHWRDDAGPLGMIAAAVLAASPHNTQPWVFRATGTRIGLWADPERVLPSVDPYLREQHTGLGCALENLVQAAAARGYDATVTPWPDPADRLLAARIDLRPAAVAASDLYDAIGHRHSNRGPYSGAAVPERTLARLTAVTSGLAPARLVWITGAAARARLGDLMVEAAEAVVADEAMSRDGFAWFRGDADAIEAHRDGLTLDGQGLSPVLLTAAKLLPATSRAKGDAFWVKQTREVHTRTAAAYGLVLVPDPRNAAQQLTGGRLLQRLHLAATVAGLGLHHMNQITERIDRDAHAGRPSPFGPRLADVVGRPGIAVLASVRIGYPERAGHRSPRRPAAAVSQR